MEGYYTNVPENAEPDTGWAMYNPGYGNEYDYGPRAPSGMPPTMPPTEEPTQLAQASMPVTDVTQTGGMSSGSRRTSPQESPEAFWNYNPAFRVMLERETRPTPWAYKRNPWSDQDPRFQQWEQLAAQQREKDLSKFERRLRIEGLMKNLGKDGYLTEWQRQSLEERKRAALAREEQRKREMDARWDARRYAQTHRPIPEGLRNTLTSVSDTFGAIRNLASSFNPKYSSTIPLTGIGSETIGSIERFAGEHVPFWPEDMANWWKLYDRLGAMKERNQAFGATLSANEQRAWDASDINPGMKPEQIARHLNVRAAILQRQLHRTMKSTVGTYDPNQIESLTGMAMPDRAPRWADTADLDALAEEGAGITGLRIGSGTVLSPTQRKMLEERLRNQNGPGR